MENVYYISRFVQLAVYNLNLNSCCTLAFKCEICRVAAIFIGQTSVSADIPLINC